jgi:uncharacterized protein YkwD
MNACTSFARAAGATLLLLAACSNSTGGLDTVSDPTVDPVEADAVYQINQAREQAGIAATLKVCTALNVSASGHSDDMRDKGYTKEVGPDGSNSRSRSCAAGYQPGCLTTTSMGELVASGIDEGTVVVDTWMKSDSGKGALLGTGFAVVGVGRALGDDGTMYWTVDLGGKDDPSCQ